MSQKTDLQNKMSSSGHFSRRQQNIFCVLYQKHKRPLFLPRPGPLFPRFLICIRDRPVP